MIEISESEVVPSFPTRAESTAEQTANAMPLSGLPPACDLNECASHECASGEVRNTTFSIRPAGVDGRDNRGAGEDLVCPESSQKTASENIASNPPHIGDAASESSPGAHCDGAPVFRPGTRIQDIEEATERARLCREYLRLTGKGQDQGSAGASPYLSGNEAAKQLGKAASWFSAMVPLYRSGGVAALLPRRRDCGTVESADAKLVSEGDIARIKAILQRTNRGKNKGSRNYAIRKYCEVADCPPAFKEMVMRRWRENKLLLPPSVIKKIWISVATFSQFRSPTAASLDFLSSPGSAMWYTDPEDGKRKFIKPGQVIEADDATINFAVIVPWEMGGCPCSEKYGVKVARFQWLVAMDVGSRFVPAWTYVCRSRSSYRKEDTVTLMNAVYRQYGEPKFWRFERNIWEALLVKRRIQTAGSRLWTVYSPHQKPFIEGLFNKCWTIMSLEDGQVGRYRGEMEKENDLLMRAQQGQFDPRGTFPLLKNAIGAFETALGEHHTGIIRSQEYGEWVPMERWEKRAMDKPLVDLDWLAAPVVRKWTVRGNLVGGQVKLVDSYSAPFDFSAPWLTQYHGAKVNCHFDPTVPRCTATVTLAEPFQDRAAGELLGNVHLVNECASYARLVLSWGDDDRGLGRKMKTQAANALRREVRTIGEDGKIAASTSEVRDGLGNSAKVETGKTYVLDPDKKFVPKSSSREQAQEPQEDLPARPRRRIRDLYAESETVNP